MCALEEIKVDNAIRWGGLHGWHDITLDAKVLKKIIQIRQRHMQMIWTDKVATRHLGGLDSVAPCADLDQEDEPNEDEKKMNKKNIKKRQSKNVFP